MNLEVRTFRSGSGHFGLGLNVRADIPTQSKKSGGHSSPDSKVRRTFWSGGQFGLSGRTLNGGELNPNVADHKIWIGCECELVNRRLRACKPGLRRSDLRLIAWTRHRNCLNLNNIFLQQSVLSRGCYEMHCGYCTAALYLDNTRSYD